MSRLVVIVLTVAGLAGPPEPAYMAGPTSTTSTSSTTTSTSTTSTTLARYRADAGGDGSLHDRIQGCESGGGANKPPNYTIANTRSTASGAAQYLDSTWAGYGGFKRAKDAPPEVQEERFQTDLANPKVGTKPWAASRHCWAAA
jgi:hypothetical protein